MKEHTSLAHSALVEVLQAASVINVSTQKGLTRGQTDGVKQKLVADGADLSRYVNAFHLLTLDCDAFVLG